MINDWWQEVLKLEGAGFTLPEASDLAALKRKHAKYEYDLRANRSTTPWRDEVEQAVRSSWRAPLDPYGGLEAQVYYATHRPSLCGHLFSSWQYGGYHFRRCVVNGMVWRLEVRWITEDVQGSYPVPPYRVVEWIEFSRW